MTLVQVAILVLLAIALGQLRGGRELALLGISALVLFWLQPAEPFRSLQYWLPLATLALAVVSWAVTSAPETRGLKQNWAAISILMGVAVLVGVLPTMGLPASLRVATPPLRWVVAGLVAVAGVTIIILRWQRLSPTWRWTAFGGILAVFIVLKSPLLTQKLLQAAVSVRGPGAPEQGIALSWLGFSYVAFRVMHTIRDRQAGRLPPATLSEYVNYVIFFPSFTAGPIDRLEHFTKELCAPVRLSNEDWIEAGSRLFMGLFKKFVVADLLAVISINDVLVQQVKYPGWMWVFLYAYAFRIFFDFSGYTDVAIGMARLLGIRLPENFTAPYLKPNLTQFWNSWHITLTQWFRSYFFNPVTRALRSAKRPLPIWMVILTTQLGTMVLIGLWHGVTGEFVLWGLWHGVGLFIHNRWSEFVKPRAPEWMQAGWGRRLSNAFGVFLTFNYVAVGWLFFTLSKPGLVWLAVTKLLGVS